MYNGAAIRSSCTTMPDSAGGTSGNLERLFNPRAIAVIGASHDTGRISGQPLQHLKARGYRGKLYPVNPGHAQVLGEPCYATVADLPEIPDLALILVAARRVPDAVRACGEKGIPFAIIVSSGFAEANDEGRRAQQQIVATAQRYGVGLIGPNCQGMINVSEGVAAGFGAPFTLPYRDGAVSVVSQSGGFGCAILMMADEEGLGFRHFITTGNECGISTLELIEHFIDDPRTRIIAAYMEGLKDAQRIPEIGSKALAAGKPLLVWKAGNSEAGARAVASHTANLSGSAALYRAAFRQAGAVEVSDVAELADYAKALLPGRLPSGNRVAVVTTSGGAGIVMADHYSLAGMQIPRLTDASLARLRELLPSFAALDNPIDTTAGLIDQPELLREALAVIAADPNVDVLSLACAALSGKVGMHIAEAVCAVQSATDKPLLLAWNAPPDLARDAYALVDRAGIPRFRTPVRCARALSALCQYADARRRFAAGRAEQPLVIERPGLREALRVRRADLTEFEAKRVLMHYGVPVTRESLATSREQALRLAEEIGYPLAMKVQSAAIPHKTEAGGVRLGLADGAAVAAAWDEILANARHHAPLARIDGILVQEQVCGATEVILGINNDPLFGPAIMFGLGGIFAEVMKDVSLRLAPVTRTEALAMIREIRSFPLLDGARGRPKADVEALADALVRLSALALDLRGEVAELDINPLFVFAAGQGVKAGDALIRPRMEPV